MHTLAHSVGPLAFAALVLTVPCVARAQSAAADVLFEEGRKALAAHDLDTACARFRSSDQIEPAAGTRANLADCEQQRGNVATAWAMYRAAIAKLPAGDSRAAVITERIRALEPRLPRITLTLAPSAPKETSVREGDVTLSISAAFGVPLPLDPGVHHLTAVAPGRAPKPFEVTLVEGKTITIEVDPGPPDGAVPTPSAVPQGNPEARSSGPWIVGGVGVAGIVVGAVTGAILLQNKSTANANCSDGPPPTCHSRAGMDAASQVRALGPATTVALGIGALGVATGGLWIALRDPAKSAVGLGVHPTYGGATLQLTRSW